MQRLLTPGNVCLPYIHLSVDLPLSLCATWALGLGVSFPPNRGELQTCDRRYNVETSEVCAKLLAPAWWLLFSQKFQVLDWGVPTQNHVNPASPDNWGSAAPRWNKKGPEGAHMRRTSAVGGLWSLSRGAGYRESGLSLQVGLNMEISRLIFHHGYYDSIW